jgi:hypothetical protein
MERATDFVHQLDARQRAMLKAMEIGRASCRERVSSSV